MRDDIKELIEELKDTYGVAMPKQEYFGDIKGIEDYITNLQKELETRQYDIEVLREHITSFQHVEDLYNQSLKDYNELQYRIEKAVEYINKHKKPLHHSFDEPDCDYWIATNPQDIIDILNGRSDE